MPDPSAPLVCLHLRNAADAGPAGAAVAAWRSAWPGLDAVVMGPPGAAVAGTGFLALPPAAGLAAALAAAHAAQPRRDLAYVCWGAQLPDDWVALLVRALRRDPRVGAALPLCDALQLFSPYAGARP
ncbi:MAG: hypothetical protein ACOY42_09680, partial [Pseudomonadota bacterium]